MVVFSGTVTIGVVDSSFVIEKVPDEAVIIVGTVEESECNDDDSVELKMASVVID